MRKLGKLPSMSNVTAGATASVDCPVGPTYYRIMFTNTGTSLATSHFNRINVYIDGKVVMTWKNLDRLLRFNAYYGRTTDSATEFELHFFHAELMDIVYRRAPGIGTKDVQTLHIEIELDATAPSDITMKAEAYIDPAPQPLGVFVKVREFPYSSAVSGEVEIDKLPRGAFYSAIHCFKADISHVEVEADSVKIVDADKTELERQQKDASPVARVPQTSYATHIDWVLEGDTAQSIQTDQLQDFRVKVTLDTSGSVDFVTETLDALSA